MVSRWRQRHAVRVMQAVAHREHMLRIYRLRREKSFHPSFAHSARTRQRILGDTQHMVIVKKTQDRARHE